MDKRTHFPGELVKADILILRSLAQKNSSQKVQVKGSGPLFSRKSNKYYLHMCLLLSHDLRYYGYFLIYKSCCMEFILTVPSQYPKMTSNGKRFASSECSGGSVHAK